MKQVQGSKSGARIGTLIVTVLLGGCGTGATTRNPAMEVSKEGSQGSAQAGSASEGLIVSKFPVGIPQEKLLTAGEYIEGIRQGNEYSLSYAQQVASILLWGHALRAAAVSPALDLTNRQATLESAMRRMLLWPLDTSGNPWPILDDQSSVPVDGAFVFSSDPAMAPLSVQAHAWDPYDSPVFVSENWPVYVRDSDKRSRLIVEGTRRQIAIAGGMIVQVVALDRLIQKKLAEPVVALERMRFGVVAEQWTEISQSVESWELRESIATGEWGFIVRFRDPQQPPIAIFQPVGDLDEGTGYRSEGVRIEDQADVEAFIQRTTSRLVLADLIPKTSLPAINALAAAEVSHAGN